jgi:hypothetical protein
MKTSSRLGNLVISYSTDVMEDVRDQDIAPDSVVIPKQKKKGRKRVNPKTRQARKLRSLFGTTKIITHLLDEKPNDFFARTETLNDCYVCAVNNLFCDFVVEPNDFRRLASRMEAKNSEMPDLIGLEGLFLHCDSHYLINVLGQCDFEVVMNFFKARTLYRLRRYFFPRRKADINCLPQVKLALEMHSHFMITVGEACDSCFHWIVVRDGIVYDSLIDKPCSIDSYDGIIDRIFFLELSPDINHKLSRLKLLTSQY